MAFGVASLIGSGGNGSQTASLGHGWLGITHMENAPAGGVVITSIAPESPAASAGLEPGDVITQIGNQPVQSVGDLNSALNGLVAGNSVQIQFQRGPADFSTLATLAVAAARRTMSFASPLVLLALLGIPLLIWWYTRQQRRRGRAAAAFVTPALTESVAPRRPRWRRHLPMLAFLIAIAVLIAAAARPQRSVAVPVTNGAIMIAQDVSSSMKATDVAPTRLAAAQHAADHFLATIPSARPGRLGRVRQDADRAPVADDRSRADADRARPAAYERRHGDRRRDPDLCCARSGACRWSTANTRLERSC